MTAPPTTAPRGLRIGQVAERLGVSERTLRYYDEIGLVTPSERSPGGNRRYADTDIQRVEHIRRLQEICGLNLNEITKVMTARDRLDALAAADTCGERQRARATEAIELLTDLRETVDDRLQRTRRFLDDLDAKIDRHRSIIQPA